MGEFYDAIKPALDQLDASGGEQIVAPRASGSLLVSDSRKATFSSDYDTNATIVKQVQAAINAAGYQPPLSQDGAYGPKTKLGVQWFQSAKGITPDGIIGDNTLKALGIKPPSGGGSGTANWLKPVAQPPIPGLAQPVVNAFPSFSTKYEGYTPFMYTDSKGYVTTGIGNLIDPVSMALSLPWKHANGAPASQQEIVDAWNTVKNAYPGTQSVASQSLTDLRLDQQGIAQLVHGKMASNQQTLQGRYPNIAKMPADAQLALHSISWAWGPAFSSVWGSLGQQFDALLNAKKPDFATASQIASQASQHEESINPGIVPRDEANTTLFENAAKVLAGKGSLSTLYFPLDYVQRHPLRTAAMVLAGLGAVGGGLAYALRKG